MLSDLKYALRSLLKTPGFTVTVLATLALCIGANTAIFSMLYALAIKPLPFHESERIVQVNNSLPKIGFDTFPSSVPQYLDFKEHATAFTDLGLWRFEEFTLGDKDGPARVTAASATADVFKVFGVQPLLGRFYSSDSQRQGNDKVVVLTQSLWESRFKADPKIIGNKIRLEGESYEIVGVAPSNLQALDGRVKLIRPLSWSDDQLVSLSRYSMSPNLYGRLKPGETLDSARSQLAALERRFYDTASAGVRDFMERSGVHVKVSNLHAQRVDFVKTALYLLYGGALFVLLIGCANVANLLLARSNSRQEEFTIRTALGASRRAIAQPLFVESLLLTGFGAALGLALAWSVLGAVNQFTSQLLPTALSFKIEGRVLGYTAAIAVLAALTMATLPVAHVLGGNRLHAPQTQSRGASTSRSARNMSSTLIVVQIAIALMLLIGAGLLIRSFANVLSVDPGFNTQHMVSARIALPMDYRRNDQAHVLQRRLLATLQEIPGLKASVATATPFQTGLPLISLALRDHPQPIGAPQPSTFILAVSPTYLDTLGIRLLEGRWFNDADTGAGREVHVVDEAFAKRYFPGRSPVGQRIAFSGDDPANPEDWPEIVGVVSNVRHNGPEEKSGNPYVYASMEQLPSQWINSFSILARTTRPLSEALTLLRQKVAAVDPTLPMFQAGSMDDIIGSSFDNRRSIVVLLGSFAALALLLSAIGIYGVLAYDVSQRTREIGIRSAIGASRLQIVMLILKQGLWKTALGLAIGLAGAFILSRFMIGLLYEVKPTDPAAYILVSILLLAVAGLASYLPARRATKVDPLVALRAE